MLYRLKKIEFLAAAVAGIFTVVPVFAVGAKHSGGKSLLLTNKLSAGILRPAQIGMLPSLSVQPTERPAKNILVQNTGANEVFQEGVNLARQQNVAGAEAAFRRAIQIDPNFAEAYANLGSILANQNKLAEAVPNFETAIRLNPNAPEFHYMLGQVLYAQNKMSDAVEAVKKARDLFRSQGKTQEASTLEQVLQDMGRR
jgi:tetratricopeptide (TPR) repeat protein